MEDFPSKDAALPLIPLTSRIPLDARSVRDTTSSSNVNDKTGTGKAVEASDDLAVSFKGVLDVDFSAPFAPLADAASILSLDSCNSCLSEASR